ncbi:hypothetical protein GCM10009765_81000 [Fodinicola feengrottensis]|uniref:Replication-relaxation n=1 Tax=Fodinicola feengrottensis TaxID=435914 RepID=A0ABN2J987_9ACTN
MPRDHRILGLLALHRVLTIDQLARLEFTSARRAQARLLELVKLELVWRARPPLSGGGTYPTRFTLGYRGACLMTAQLGDKPPRRAAYKHRNDGMLLSPKLRHLLGINDFFTDLAGYHRDHPDLTGPGGQPGGLTLWMPERTAIGQVQALTSEMYARIKPDAYGCFEAEGRAVRFMLEHDTGTEPIATLVDKVLTYDHVNASRAGIVLFWLPSTTRETHLRAALDRQRHHIEVATAARDHGHPDGPAGPIWAVHQSTGTEYDGSLFRARLHQLPEHGPDAHHHPDLGLPFHQAAVTNTAVMLSPWGEP